MRRVWSPESPWPSGSAFRPATGIASPPAAKTPSVSIPASFPGMPQAMRWHVPMHVKMPPSSLSPSSVRPSIVFMTGMSRPRETAWQHPKRISRSWSPGAKDIQGETGIQLLWGTANLFGHPRYMNGAATNPDFAAVANAGAQVKAALDATIALGGANYVFWGGREGYASLLNTQPGREIEHLARFLAMARDYGRANGFTGTFLVEPKTMEPMKHQYDFDAQTVIGFPRHFGLDGDFMVNVEANHATLAGHAFAHELQMCADAKLLGSVDANRGDPQNGWDTDQFPMDINDAVQAMMVVMRAGGLGNGGFNFDAKLRRESVDPEDLFVGHIGAMDSFARGLIIADRVERDGRIRQRLAARYASFDEGVGARFESGEHRLTDLRDFAAANGEVPRLSGKQELLENILGDLMFRPSK